ncbi:hypothetical protein AB0F30_24185 [Streptomyces sp. NPDC029006]|uniref:hypothetical protein n=1 Tax=Streptomyces sp. NPDC029006 TaxID=3155467 RepID=UPI0033D6E16F
MGGPLPQHLLDGGPGAAGGGHLVLDVAQFLIEPAAEQAALPFGPSAVIRTGVRAVEGAEGGELWGVLGR